MQRCRNTISPRISLANSLASLGSIAPLSRYNNQMRFFHPRRLFLSLDQRSPFPLPITRINGRRLLDRIPQLDASSQSRPRSYSGHTTR